MKRKQIYITKESDEALDQLANERGVSQSELVRSAIREYIASNAEVQKKAVIDRAFGLWKTRDDLPDLESLRAELDREL